jgi:hypothetical protein
MNHDQHYDLGVHVHYHVLGTGKVTKVMQSKCRSIDIPRAVNTLLESVAHAKSMKQPQNGMWFAANALQLQGRKQRAPYSCVDWLKPRTIMQHDQAWVALTLEAHSLRWMTSPHKLETRRRCVKRDGRNASSMMFSFDCIGWSTPPIIPSDIGRVAVIMKTTFPCLAICSLA